MIPGIWQIADHPMSLLPAEVEIDDHPISVVVTGVSEEGSIETHIVTADTWGELSGKGYTRS